MVEIHLSDNLPILLSGFTGLTFSSSDKYTLLKLLGTKSLYHLMGLHLLTTRPGTRRHKITVMLLCQKQIGHKKYTFYIKLENKSFPFLLTELG